MTPISHDTHLGDSDTLPAFIFQLADALRRHLGARVEVEPVEGSDRFRLAVLSPGFQDVPHMERQDRIWDVVEELLTPEQILRLTLILAFAPGEVEWDEQDHDG